MRSIITNEKHNFSLYDTSTSIFFNNEKVKDEIVDFLKENGFIIVDNKYFTADVTVKSFLASNKFKMNLIPYFGIKSIISKKLSEISFEDFIYLKCIVLSCVAFDRLVFNDVLMYLTDNKKRKIIKYLKDNKIVFYNFTSNCEECLYAPYIIMINNNVVAIEGATKNVLLEEKMIKKLGFGIPFTVDLSLQLKSYGLVDTIYYDVDRIVEDLWK